MRSFCSHCSDEFKNAFAEYAATLRKERTADEYVGHINQICNTLSLDFPEITEGMAFQYFHDLRQTCREGKLSIQTARIRLSCYKSVARYIVKHEYFPNYHNPFLKIMPPAQSDDAIDPHRIPSMKEMDKILTAAKSNPTFYLILVLAIRTGMTVTNILSVTASRIIREDGKMFLRLPAKTAFREDRYVMVPQDVAEIVEDYLSGIFPDPKGHIFFNMHGRPLTIKNVDSGMEKIVRASGIENSYTMKDLRSRALLEMVKAGADPKAIEDYTGIGRMRIKSFLDAQGIITDDCPAGMMNFQIKAPKSA